VQSPDSAALPRFVVPSTSLLFENRILTLLSNVRLLQLKIKKGVFPLRKDALVFYILNVSHTIVQNFNCAKLCPDFLALLTILSSIFLFEIKKASECNLS
jgi:hypothetical protein